MRTLTEKIINEVTEMVFELEEYETLTVRETESVIEGITKYTEELFTKLEDAALMLYGARDFSLVANDETDRILNELVDLIDEFAGIGE